jgi:hypothetical protein
MIVWHLKKSMIRFFSIKNELMIIFPDVYYSKLLFEKFKLKFIETPIEVRFFLLKIYHFVSWHWFLKSSHFPKTSFIHINGYIDWTWFQCKKMILKLNAWTKIKKNKLPSSQKLAKLIKWINKIELTSIINFFIL